MLFTLLFSTFAHAACPVIRLADTTPATIKLEGPLTACRAEQVFTCTKGALRISAEVKSRTSDSRQITAFCTPMVDTRHPGKSLTPAPDESEPTYTPDFDDEFSAFKKAHDAN